MVGRPAQSAWRAEAALAFNALVWGSTFVIVKEALDDISTILFLAFRFALATAALALVFRRRSAPMGNWRKGLAGGALAGLFLYAGYAFQTVGLRYTTASNSAFLTGLSIILVPFLAAIVYKQRRKPRSVEVFGALLALAGTGLMTLPGGRFEFNRGDLLTIACAFGFALHILALGHYARLVSYESLAVLQIATAAVLCLGTFWWMEVPLVVWSPAVVGAILITGVLATAVAFTIQAWAQRYTTPTRTALIFALEPVFAWVTSHLFAGERFSLSGAFGAGLILSGILLVELKPGRAAAHL
jgi:drug/metabolite transporter (DMT)-like permease